MTREMFDKGLKIRREVLGDEYVSKAMNRADDFIGPMQEFVTKNCWGEVWGRPGLSRKSRSMITLAMLTALNRPHETRAHLRGAIQNGLTKEEISEILLHSAVYCGVPAALDSFRVAQAFFSDIEAPGASGKE